MDRSNDEGAGFDSYNWQQRKRELEEERFEKSRDLDQRRDKRANRTRPWRSKTPG